MTSRSMEHRLEDRLGGTGAVLVAVLVFNLLCVAYYPALRGPFVFDGVPGIVENQDLRETARPWVVFRRHDSSLQFDRRPVTALSMMGNYALAGLNPSVFRVTNVLLHWLTGLTLVHATGLMARRLGCQTPRLLAWTIVLLWLFHPLATSAVSYVYQRSEILMALFYVLAIMAVLRAADSPARERRWLELATAAALCSALSKEPGVTLLAALPLVERVCVFTTWREWWTRRWKFYGVLLFLLSAVTLWLLSGVRTEDLDDGGVLSTPWGYFQAQCRVLVRYLSLVFWPHPLVFFPSAKHPAELGQWVPHGLFLALLFAAGLLAGLKHRWLLLPVGLFLVILSPTSSFLPIPLEPEVEFRMYLPSVLVIAVVVVIAARWLRQQWEGPRIGAGVLLAVLVSLALLSFRRNIDYSSAPRLWASVVRHDPINIKAWFHLGHESLHAGDLETVRRAAGNLLQIGANSGDPVGTEAGTFLMALWAIERGDPAEGAKVLLALREKESDLPGLDVYCALGLARSGEFERARARLVGLTAPEREALLARLVDAEVLLGLGELEAARSLHGEIAMLAPDSWRLAVLGEMIAAAETQRNP